MSCVSEKELKNLDAPKVSEYRERSDYPDLVAGMDQLDPSISLPRVNRESFHQMARYVDAYSEMVQCEEKGRIVVSFVVTKEAKVDAPKIDRSLDQNCNRAVLASLKKLKFDEAGTKNEEPANILFAVPVTFK